MVKTWIGSVAMGVACATLSCEASEEACEGAERCACYPNDTCDEGLECRSQLCVAASDDTDDDASSDVDGGMRDDASSVEPTDAPTPGEASPVAAGGESNDVPNGESGGSSPGGGGTTQEENDPGSAGNEGMNGQRGGAGGTSGTCEANCGGASHAGSDAGGSGSETVSGGGGSISNDPCVPSTDAESLTLPIVFRDFKGIGWDGAPAPEFDATGHPDFENEELVLDSPKATVLSSEEQSFTDVPAPTPGLVNTLLGSGQDGELSRKPTFRNTGTPAQLTGATEFHQWFVASPGVNLEIHYFS